MGCLDGCGFGKKSAETGIKIPENIAMGICDEKILGWLPTQKILADYPYLNQG